MAKKTKSPTEITSIRHTKDTRVNIPTEELGDFVADDQCRLLRLDFRLPHSAALKPVLDRLYAEFNYPDSATDPIQIVRRFERPDDREVVGFVAAALAFGRVTSVLQSIERVLAIMGPRPAAYVHRFDPRRHGPAFDGVVHRWTREKDLIALIWVLRQMIDRAGSVEGFFAEDLDPSAADIEAALDSFSSRALALDLKEAYGRVPHPSTPRHPRRRSGRPKSDEGRWPGVCYFFPRPSAGSGCKRLNLFLRWMIRHDALDLGVWTRVSPAKLIVPLDTHVIRVGRCLRLTKYTSPGWRMARDITASLRALDPDDPVKYDFALCHLGMMNACGFGRPQRDSQCPLRGHCSPGRISSPKPQVTSPKSAGSHKSPVVRRRGRRPKTGE